MFRSFLIAGLAGMSLCLAAAQAEPVTEEHFKIVTTGDLATLCAAEPGETLGTAALNFCHGFAVGVYQVLAEQQTAPRSRKMFCLPNPQPTRNEAIATFVQWARAKPERASLAPADGLAQFLSDQYPCATKR